MVRSASTEAGSQSDRAARIAALNFPYGSAPKERITTCNLCGHDVFTVLTHRDRYGFDAKATACVACSLTVLNPRMTPAAYAGFYRDVYRPLVSAYHGRRIDAETIQAEQQDYAQHMAAFLAPFLATRKCQDLLDVGGSTGIVAGHLSREFGMRATVLDPAPAEVAVAERLGIRTVTALVEDWQPRERYDMIGLFQTVDHLLDVAGVLRKLRSALAEDGLFVLDIVDFRAACLRNGSVEEAIKIDHPYSLTEDTMELFFARTGFEPVGKSYAADHLHVVYVCRTRPPEADARPDDECVRAFFREVRSIQNARHTRG